MDPNKVKKKDGKVFEVNKVQTVGSYFVNSDYELKLFSNNRIERTGYLPIASLKPNSEGLPIFTLRWDQKGNTVDVDIDNNVDSDTIQKFKNGKNGCSGHHSIKEKIGKDWVLKFNIKFFGKKIFKGNLKVPVTTELEGSGGVKVGGSGIVEFIPGKK